MLCTNFVCCWLQKKFLAQDGKMRSFGFLVVAFYCEEGKEEALNEEAQRFSQLSRRPAPLRKIERIASAKYRIGLA